MSAGHYQLLGEVGFLYLIPNFLRMKEAHRSGADKLQRFDHPPPPWGALLSSAVPVPHRRVGRRVVGRYALRQLGSVRQGAVASGEGPGLRAAVGKYSYHFPTDGPQHRRRRRSLTTAQRTAPARGMALRPSYSVPGAAPARRTNG